MVSAEPALLIVAGCCAGSCGELCAIVTGHMQMEEPGLPGKAPCGSPASGKGGELWWAFQSISPAPTSVPPSYLRALAQRKGFFSKGAWLSNGLHRL